MEHISPRFRIQQKSWRDLGEISAISARSHQSRRDLADLGEISVKILHGRALTNQATKHTQTGCETVTTDNETTIPPIPLRPNLDNCGFKKLKQNHNKLSLEMTRGKQKATGFINFYIFLRGGLDEGKVSIFTCHSPF